MPGGLASGTPTKAQAPLPAPEQACRAAVSALWPQWRFAEVSAEVAQWASQHHESPTRARGDFDGDGIEDIALFVQAAPADPRSLKIAACLSSSGHTRPVVVDEPYCGDGITTVRKGMPYYDFETGLEGTYPRDGVHAYCFERAGATYLFSSDGFQRIVDSD